MRVSSFAHRRSGVASDGPACGVSCGTDPAVYGRESQKLCDLSCTGLVLRPCNRRAALRDQGGPYADIFAACAPFKTGERRPDFTVLRVGSDPAYQSLCGGGCGTSALLRGHGGHSAP